MLEGIRKTPFTQQEDAQIMRGVMEIGNKFGDIARTYLENRTEMQVKNR